MYIIILAVMVSCSYFIRNGWGLHSRITMTLDLDDTTTLRDWILHLGYLVPARHKCGCQTGCFLDFDCSLGELHCDGFELDTEHSLGQHIMATTSLRLSFCVFFYRYPLEQRGRPLRTVRFILDGVFHREQVGGGDAGH